MAQSLGFQVIDFEAMAAQLPKDDMLDDITHPKPDFLLQVRLPMPCRCSSCKCNLEDMGMI